MRHDLGRVAAIGAVCVGSAAVARPEIVVVQQSRSVWAYARAINPVGSPSQLIIEDGAAAPGFGPFQHAAIAEATLLSYGKGVGAQDSTTGAGALTGTCTAHAESRRGSLSTDGAGKATSEYEVTFQVTAPTEFRLLATLSLAATASADPIIAEASFELLDGAGAVAAASITWTGVHQAALDLTDTLDPGEYVIRASARAERYGLPVPGSGSNPIPSSDALLEFAFTVSDSCYPDCNADGALTVADFGCFQTKFVAGDLYADCNQSGTLTVADFGCFQTAFVAGCP